MGGQTKARACSVWTNPQKLAPWGFEPRPLDEHTSRSQVYTTYPTHVYFGTKAICSKFAMV